jgi:DNA-directed RNA polymerase subunit RPC12/RpoP
MIPDENQQASYRCARCGWFTLPELPTAAPVLQIQCRFCQATVFVRDLTASELIELHGLLAERRQERGPARPHPPADLPPLDCFEAVKR